MHFGAVAAFWAAATIVTALASWLPSRDQRGRLRPLADLDRRPLLARSPRARRTPSSSVGVWRPRRGCAAACAARPLRLVADVTAAANQAALSDGVTPTAETTAHRRAAGRRPVPARAELTRSPRPFPASPPRSSRLAPSPRPLPVRRQPPQVPLLVGDDGAPRDLEPRGSSSMYPPTISCSASKVFGISRTSAGFWGSATTTVMVSAFISSRA
jgi:hypothetical protein